MTLLRKAKSDILFSNSVFIFLTRFFPVLAVLLVQVYYSRHLAQHVYGSYQNFWVQLYVFAAIACAGAHVFIVTYPPAFLIRLVFRADSKYFYYFFSWLLLVCLVFAFMQLNKGYSLWLPFIFLLIHSVSAIAESMLIVFKKLRQLALVNFIYALAFAYLHYASLSNGLDLQDIFTYVLVLMFMKLVSYLASAYSYMLIHKKEALSEELYTAGVGSLWLHMGLYDFLNILSRWVDKFVVSLLLAESISGIYFNGAVDIPFIPLIVGAAGSATLIQLASKEDKSEPAYTVALANRTSRLLSAVVFPLFFFFVLFRHELFDVVFTSKFSEAVPIFLASCLMIPLRAYSFTTVLQNRNRGAIINAGAVIDLVLAFALIYPFYQLFGLAGIALSFSLATYVQAGFYLYHTSKILGVPVLTLFPYKNWLAKLTVFGSLFTATHYLFSLYLSAKLSLSLGFVIAALTILISISLELRRPAKQ